MKALFNDNVWKYMRKISKDRFPREACSIIVGQKEDEVFRVKKMMEAKNSQRSNSSFKIDPQDLVETLDNIEESNGELIGFFHSHPNLHSFVSDRDEKFMKLWPGKIWVIAGTDDRGRVTEVRAFVWSDGVVEVNIETRD